MYKNDKCDNWFFRGKNKLLRGLELLSRLCKTKKK